MCAEIKDSSASRKECILVYIKIVIEMFDFRIINESILSCCKVKEIVKLLLQKCILWVSTIANPERSSEVVAVAFNFALLTWRRLQERPVGVRVPSLFDCFSGSSAFEVKLCWKKIRNDDHFFETLKIMCAALDCYLSPLYMIH